MRIDAMSVIKTLVIVAIAASLFMVRDVVLVILAAIVIASAIEPGARWFERHGVPRVLGVLFIYAVAAVIFLGTFYYLLVPLLFESTSFLVKLPEYTRLIEQAASSPTPSNSAFFEGIRSTISIPTLIQQINGIIMNASSGFFGAIDVIFGGALSFLLVLVLSFYLSVQDDGIGTFLKIVTPLKYEQYVIGLWRRSREKIGLWMQGQLLLGVIVAVLTYLGLTLLGVPNALLLAFIAGLFELIPLFGPILAAVPAIIFAFGAEGVTLALLVAALFIIIQQFESQLIYPLVVKKVIGVPPTISILALVIGGKLAGFIGLLLSVPIATMLMELIADYEKSKIEESNAS